MSTELAPFDLANSYGIVTTSLNWVWDADALEFVRMTQPGGGGGGTVDQGAAGSDPWLVALPTGAATSAKQDTGNTSLATIAGKDFATSAKQDTGNTSLATIAAKDFATQTTLALIKAKTDNIPGLGQALAAASTPVVLPAAQITTLTPPAAITGYALEAGHLAAIDTSTAKIPAQGQALAAASLPVVLPAAQITTLTPPTSITANAGTNLNTSALALDTSVNNLLKPASTLAAVTALGSITNALPAGNNNIGDVDIASVPALTKGTQGSTGFSVQQLRDAGRTQLAFYATGITAGTSGTEAMISLVKVGTVGGAAPAGATSFTVTSGKRFRITAVMGGVRNMAATTATATFTLRVNAAGATITSSTGIAWQFRTAVGATINSWDRAYLDLLEGCEILGDGTLTFGVSVNPVWTTTAAQYDFTMLGYEY